MQGQLRNVHISVVHKIIKNICRIECMFFDSKLETWKEALKIEDITNRETLHDNLSTMPQVMEALLY